MLSVDTVLAIGRSCGELQMLWLEDPRTLQKRIGTKFTWNPRRKHFTMHHYIDDGYRFLHALQQSGVTNMMQSPQYMEAFFGIPLRTAAEIFVVWGQAMEMKGRLLERNTSA